MKRKSSTPRSKYSDEHVEPMLVTGYSETKMIAFADHRPGPEDELSEREEAVREALTKIPESEARVLKGWLRGKAQDTMAKEEGVTQAAISYRIDRAKRRLAPLLAAVVSDGLSNKPVRTISENKSSEVAARIRTVVDACGMSGAVEDLRAGQRVLWSVMAGLPVRESTLSRLTSRLAELGV